MHKFIVIIILFIGFQSSASGQNKSKMSNRARSAPDVHQMVMHNIDSAKYYLESATSRSFDFIENGFRTIGGNKKGYQKELGALYEVLGDSYSQLEQYDLAHENYVLASSYYESIPNSIFLKKLKVILLQSDYTKANQLLNSLSESELSEPEQLDYYKYKGDLLVAKQRLDLGLRSYQQGLKLAITLSNNSYQVVFDNKIAAIYSQKGAIKLAEDHLSNSMRNVANEEIEEQMDQVETNADFYRQNNQLEKEVTLRKQNIQACKKVEETPKVAQNIQHQNIKIADAYIELEEYDNAIPYLEKGKKKNAKYSDIDLEIKATKKLSAVYEKIGNYDKALVNYRQYVDLTDKQYQIKENEIKAAVKLTNELAKKQKRIEVLELDRELKSSKDQLYKKDISISQLNTNRQNLIIYSLLGGLLLSLIALFFFYKNNKQRKIANNLLALKALKSQMNPHFIFNALNSVNNFIALNDERKANKYLTDFSSLMRKVLDVSEKDFTSLDEEMELIKLYIMLEHVRFEDKFDYRIVIEPDMNLNKILIPPMLIQPYIENAVWHGMRYKETKGHIDILINSDTQRNAIITITDNGVGRKQSQKLKSTNQLKKNSTGMKNTAERIDIINKMYNKNIHMEISDLNTDGSGTIVKLIIPMD